MKLPEWAAWEGECSLPALPRIYGGEKNKKGKIERKDLILFSIIFSLLSPPEPHPLLRLPSDSH